MLPTQSSDRIASLTARLRNFAAARDWNAFHTPKNLAMALAAEVGDIQIYLTHLADRQGLDPVSAAEDKIAANESKYPVGKPRGKARKYTELGGAK